MKRRNKEKLPSHVLIVSDMEGSSGCFSKHASEFLNTEWARACYHMTCDVNTAAAALFDAGVKRVTVKDFHRTAYNLFPSLLDKRITLISGYRTGRVSGMGDLPGIDAAVFIGMHAPSGSKGFIAHTFTSRIARISAGRRTVSELELFSSALSAADIPPLFFSGCPDACTDALKAIPGISVYPIDKRKGEAVFDKVIWRKGLYESMQKSLRGGTPDCFNPSGPFTVKMRMRDGERAAEKISSPWKLDRKGDTILFAAADYREIYNLLSKVMYITPLLEKIIGPALFAYRIIGRLGILWAGCYLRFLRP